MYKPLLGLKGSADPVQIQDRLQHHPQVFEFFTAESDINPEGLKRLAAGIEQVKAAGIKHIVIHHPMKFKGRNTDVVAPEKEYPELYAFIEDSTEKLLKIATDYDVQLLVHGGYMGFVPEYLPLYPSLEAARQAVYHRLDRFAQAGGNHIMFENSIAAVFSYGDPHQEDEILSHHYRLAFDTSHCFIFSHGSNQALQASLKHLGPSVVHYHLVDSMGKTHDSLQLGKGKIDWAKVLPLLNPKATSIYEINLHDQKICTEQVASHQYLSQVYRNMNKN